MTGPVRRLRRADQVHAHGEGEGEGERATRQRQRSEVRTMRGDALHCREARCCSGEGGGRQPNRASQREGNSGPRRSGAGWAGLHTVTPSPSQPRPGRTPRARTHAYTERAAILAPSGVCARDVWEHRFRVAWMGERSLTATLCPPSLCPSRSADQSAAAVRAASPPRLHAATNSSTHTAHDHTHAHRTSRLPPLPLFGGRPTVHPSRWRLFARRGGTRLCCCSRFFLFFFSALLDA